MVLPGESVGSSCIAEAQQIDEHTCTIAVLHLIERRRHRPPQESVVALFHRLIGVRLLACVPKAKDHWNEKSTTQIKLSGS